MQETSSSLKTYFIVVALLGIWSAKDSVLNMGVLMSAGLWGYVAILLGLATLALSLGYLYVGVNLATILVEKPEVAKAVIYASLGLAAIRFAITVLLTGVGGAIMGSIPLAISVALMAYLLVNVNRLAAQAVAAKA